MKTILLKSILFCLTAITLAAAPKAIVFDFGGVLTQKPNREEVIRFIRESFNISDEEFEKINRKKRLALKQGKTDIEFWLTYADTKNIQLPLDWLNTLKSIIKTAIGVNPEMYALVDELKELQIPIALFSNVSLRHSKLIRDLGLYEPFDLCLLSCEIEVKKPDPKAYEILLATLNLPPQDVLFIDDRLENVEAAQKMGIDALLFESLEQLREELSNRNLTLEENQL